MDDWSYTSPEDDVPVDVYAASDAARADQTWRKAEARRANLARTASTQGEVELDQAPPWETVEATSFDDCPQPPGSVDAPGIPVTF